mmetsp:Transcript_104447/g.304885  ORF Transcript_104447/g.304885 Transcript_104447/m.304885 type:complete len:300 (-) Transcript_104447:1461-2360(-)
MLSAAFLDALAEALPRAPALSLHPLREPDVLCRHLRVLHLHLAAGDGEVLEVLQQALVHLALALAEHVWAEGLDVPAARPAGGGVVLDVRQALRGLGHEHGLAWKAFDLLALPDETPDNGALVAEGLRLRQSYLYGAELGSVLAAVLREAVVEAEVEVREPRVRVEDGLAALGHVWVLLLLLQALPHPALFRRHVLAEQLPRAAAQLRRLRVQPDVLGLPLVLLQLRLCAAFGELGAVPQQALVHATLPWLHVRTETLDVGRAGIVGVCLEVDVPSTLLHVAEQFLLAGCVANLLEVFG